MTRVRMFVNCIMIAFLIAVVFTPFSQVAAKPSEIATSEIITRAKNWVDRSIAYSQSTTTDGYRQDCSGFVSYAWQLSNSLGRPESKTTRTLSEVSYPISKDSLRSGDILLYPGSHVLIFSSWTNSMKTKYWAYEMTPGKARYIDVPYPYFNNKDKYKPYRYSGITSSANAAYKKSTTTTSIQSFTYSSGKAVDGNLTTRWSSSTSSSTQWLIIDFGSNLVFDQITILWEAAYARNYFVGWSDNCTNFYGYYRTKTSAQKDVINISSSRTARCVGVKMTEKAPGFSNYSIWELMVYKR